MDKNTAAPAQSGEPVAGELEAFEAWFKTSGFWNNAITEKAWRAACAWMRETNAAACDAIVEQSKNSLFRSGAKICAGHIRNGAPEQCDVPPDGWSCSRPKGHTGPCAATQTAVVLNDERAAFKDFHASLNRLSANTSVSMEDRVMILSNATFLLDEYTRAAPQPVAQPVEQTVQVPQFDAKHVSLKERADGKLVLTLLLDGVEGAPRYKVIPVNPGVVRVAQPVEQPVQRNTVSDAVKLACESRGVEFDADSAGATLGRLLRWERENIAQPVEQTRALTVEQKAALDLAVLNLKSHGDDQLLAAVTPLIDFYARSLTAARPASGEIE